MLPKFKKPQRVPDVVLKTPSGTEVFFWFILESEQFRFYYKYNHGGWTDGASCGGMASDGTLRFCHSDRKIEQIDSWGKWDSEDYEEGDEDYEDEDDVRSEEVIEAYNKFITQAIEEALLGDPT